MAKHVSRKAEIQEVINSTVSVQLPLPMLSALVDVRASLQELCIETGQQVLQAMMEHDREALCGPKGRHDVERRAWRGGTTPSSYIRCATRSRGTSVAKMRESSPSGARRRPWR